MYAKYMSTGVPPTKDEIEQSWISDKFAIKMSSNK
jgi:hypothetical protein